MNISETIVRKNAHNFSIFVTDKGDLTFQMDDGEEKHARALKDGKLLFIGTLEVVANGEIQEWKDMDLPEADFILLAEAQQRVRDALDEEQTMERLKREGEDKSNMLKRIDKWKKRVKWYRKERKGKKIFYAIHEFTIGAQSYRFYERRMDNPIAWDGIIINPIYKVDRELDGTGAVPVQKGELTFWYYYDNVQGWFNVRELTLNEMICVGIIHSYGLVREGKI